MKTTPFLIAFLLCLFPSLRAQHTLPDSPQRSATTHVYTISKESLRKIHLKNVPVTDEMLGTEVERYVSSRHSASLKRGNYITVKAVKGELLYNSYTVDDLYAKVIPNKQPMLCLHDSLGNLLTEAIVKCGAKTIRFDARIQAYPLPKIKDERMLEVNNKGVYHYLEIENDDYSPSRNSFNSLWQKTQWHWSKLKRNVYGLFDADYRSRRVKYTGFVVFSKPKYKPNETVKLKAYIAENNGKPYNKPVDLRLSGYYPTRIDTVLAKSLSPYRPGMYEYQFRLTDSLNLSLDDYYTVSLESGKKRDNAISSSFKYEEYELKGIRFSMTTDKETYAQEDSVRIKLKVVDENNMAVYGGSARITVLPLQVDKFRSNTLFFVPDTLWTSTVSLSETSEHTTLIPNAIFPAGVDLSYRVMCTYLSADNEKHTANKTLERKADSYLLDFALSKGMLTIKQLHNGLSQPVKALIETAGEYGESLASDSVMLPHTMPVPWYASDITVSTAQARDWYDPTELPKDEEQLGYDFYRRNDSIYLRVDNPAAIPFWYKIRRGRHEIASGHATSLNYAAPDKGNKGYSMQLSYLFGEESKHIARSLPYGQKNMVLDVTTPTVVYPGQKAAVRLSVKDGKGRPVKDADITAYSFTSKFDYTMPSVTVRGKAHHARPYKPVDYSTDEASIYNRSGSLNWERWKSPLSLDTLAYYEFLYPTNTIYRYTEASPDSVTQISPYVVLNGAVQPVYMLWIDNRLYYTAAAAQTGPYTFLVKPGRRNLRIRTNDREVKATVYVEQGMSNIFSLDAGKEYAKVPSVRGEKGLSESVGKEGSFESRRLEKKRRNMLSKEEKEYLSSQLISQNHSFDKLLLPGISREVSLPTFIHSGSTLYNLSQAATEYYDYRTRSYLPRPMIVGPFPERNSLNGIPNMASIYSGSQLMVNFNIEEKSHYTFYKHFYKVKSPEEWSMALTSLSNQPPSTNFRQRLLNLGAIEREFGRNLYRILREGTGAAVAKSLQSDAKASGNTSRLKLSLGKNEKGEYFAPLLILIQPEKEGEKGREVNGKKEEEVKGETDRKAEGETEEEQLYYGRTRTFDDLPQGRVNISLVFNDSTVHTQSVELRACGMNYLQIDSIATAHDSGKETASRALELLYRHITKVAPFNPHTANRLAEEKQAAPAYEVVHSEENASRGVITGRVVMPPDNEPLIGATVRVSGSNNGTFTDIDGRFSLMAPAGSKIEVCYIGCVPQAFTCSEGGDYTIRLGADQQMLDEVVVVGYGTAKKKNLSFSMATYTTAVELDKYTAASIREQLAGLPGSAADVQLRGSVAGLQIRGSGSSSAEASPLIIINGVPFSGRLEDLDPQSLRNISILKGADATGLYGSRAAHGVVLIQTTAAAAADIPGMDTGEAASGANSMRRNFHDDAFWQPRIKTDAQGEASFEVTYPDDITSWRACFIAIGNKKQSDVKELTINSFKALSARLSMPHFAIRGDRFDAVGRIANHLGDSLSLDRSIVCNGHITENRLRIATSHTDAIPVKAETTDGRPDAIPAKSEAADSLTVAYSLSRENGYFDGEERSIPLFEQGMLQTHGDFRLLNDSATHRLKTDPALGAVTFYAETSGLELFLREIDKVERYPYLCNEQMASKVKALLSRKRALELMGRPFEEERKIRTLIDRLERNRNTEDLWGWWNKGKTEHWISQQVLSALLDAEEAGYKTTLNRTALWKMYEADLAKSLSDLPLAKRPPASFVKQELLDRLLLLKRLDAPIDYASYLKAIDTALASQSTADRLKVLYAQSLTGQAVPADSVMQHARKTMLGSMYWGEEQSAKQHQPLLIRTPMLPYENNIESTLTAYRLLKSAGGHEEELARVRNYFFECRGQGNWRNTYESSRIIETILPDMLMAGQSFSETSAYINGKEITGFPYTERFEAATPVEIKKKGTSPLFVTAYQQAWNKSPERESAKGFAVTSVLKAGNDTVVQLKAGTPVRLEVRVQVDADANYVQIEIPIPAGCSYESKAQNAPWREAHREYFKEKTVLFCNHLSKGEHTFSVELLPRYTGEYHLNPAKAELMYFPLFYGNEEAKSVSIQ